MNHNTRSHMNDIYKTTENKSWVVPNPRKKYKVGPKCYTCNPSGADKDDRLERLKQERDNDNYIPRPVHRV